ncbi:3897_t:CDS:2 [Funneliformis caledonium]|uniref:3897_t:CDS:1 n=1 Tax=Funneliformis caledonium TaxID=1117310 RepID=A0A9N9ARP0_9GLOM|nr:3897_t:CDS:2 [Funneliformis caledonium]
MIDGHHIQPKYSTNYAELPTSHNKEPSQWLPKLDDVPLLEIENHANNDNLSELPKRENEALETRVNAYDNNDVVSEEEITEQELFNKINEIMKQEYGKANKSHVNEPYQFLPRDYIERVRQSDEFQGYEKRAPFNHPRCRKCENVNRHRGKFSRMRYVTITDDPIRENELKPLIRNQFTTSENMQCDEQTSGHGNGVYNPTCLNGGSTIKAASLEYWGDHSIDSVEHSLTQSNESVNWFQNFNQLHLLRNNTTSPNLRQRNRNVKFFI